LLFVEEVGASTVNNFYALDYSKGMIKIECANSAESSKFAPHKLMP